MEGQQNDARAADGHRVRIFQPRNGCEQRTETKRA